jgi:hypothetical protein
MSEHIDTEAKAYVFKTGRLFTRRRYTVVLYIGDIATEIHAHAPNFRSAAECGRYLTKNAADLLREHGLMSHAYEQVRHARLGDPSLPKVDERVYLTEDIGPFAEGTECVVLTSGWDEAEVGEYQFPITVYPIGESQDVRIPLRITEFSTEQA